jgi:D-3-phosphoglycerate dehydrogenase
VPKQFRVVQIANDGLPLPDWVEPRFSAANVECTYHQCHNRDDLKSCVEGADMLWLMGGRRGLVIEENMDLFPDIGAVQRVGSGTDNIDHDACTKRGILVVHTPEDVTEVTSDHVITMLLSVVRRIVWHDRNIRNGFWDQKVPLPVCTLRGAELGIVGFGRIGKAVVEKLSGFQMTIRVYDPYADPEMIVSLGCEPIGLEALLKKSQLIALVCALTDETRGLIGLDQLNMMRQDAVLVNCARGPIVDDQALYETLKNNRIAGAALDVFCETPLPEDDVLRSLENVNFTPHAAGVPLPFPDALYENQVLSIIDLAEGRMPRWIANRGVKPKWNLQLQ